MSSSKNWDLQVDPDVSKSLKKIPRREAEVILEVIRLLPFNPHFGDIQRMKGSSNIWRRRVGNYRLFYKIDSEKRIILVFRLGRRTSKTYKKK